MQAAPSIGLDLLMNALAWQDEKGRVRVSWHRADDLLARHWLDAGQAEPLATIGGPIEAAR